MKDQKAERALRCQMWLSPATLQQSAIKQAIRLASAQVFQDEQQVQRRADMILSDASLFWCHLTICSLLRVPADEATPITFSGDRCLLFESNDIGNNGDQAG